MSEKKEYIERGAVMRTWIPISEGLPSEDEHVLAIVNADHKNIEFVCAVEICQYSREGWFVEEYPEIEGAEVLYWMPIPRMPRDVEAIIKEMTEVSK